MSSPYVGEIRMFGGNFAPAGWMTCDGQLLPISEFDTLFNLIGTTYGGDGQSTFGLPSLNGRVPVPIGSNGTSTYALGQSGGVQSLTLTTNQIPVHNHQMVCSQDIATGQSASHAVLAQSTVAEMYFDDVTDSNLAASSITLTGGSQPHDNMQPYLAITFIISMFGVFPSPT